MVGTDPRGTVSKAGVPHFLCPHADVSPSSTALGVGRLTLRRGNKKPGKEAPENLD